MQTFGDGIRINLFQAGTPLGFWPFAGQHFEVVYNCSVLQLGDKTAYELRYPDRPLPELYPFGCKVTYVPQKKARHKFESRAVSAIFLGWVPLPGGIVAKEYKVIPLSDLVSGRKLRVITTRDVRFPSHESYEFPLADFRRYHEVAEYIKNHSFVSSRDFAKRIFGDNPYDESLVNPDQQIYQQIYQLEPEETVEEDDTEPLEEEDADDEKEIVDVIPSEKPPKPNKNESSNLGCNGQPSSSSSSSTQSLEEPASSQSPLGPNPSGSTAPRQVSEAVKRLLEKQEKQREAARRAREARNKAGTVASEPSSQPSSPAPASPATPIMTVTPTSVDKSVPNCRKLIEFGCSEESNIGNCASEFFSQVYRVTERDDALDICTIMSIVNVIVDNPGIHLFGSIPCTPWSRWQTYNLSRLGCKFRKYLEAERQKSIEFVRTFATLAGIVRDTGGTVSFEWPRYCTGWGIGELMDMIVDCRLTAVDFDGCMLGTCDDQGRPIKKPWRIVTSSPSLVEHLSKFKCCGTHSHVPCEGKYTRRTGFYSVKMARAILVGLFGKRPKVKASCALPAPSTGESQRAGNAQQFKISEPSTSHHCLANVVGGPACKLVSDDRADTFTVNARKSFCTDCLERLCSCVCARSFECAGAHEYVGSVGCAELDSFGRPNVGSVLAFPVLGNYRKPRNSGGLALAESLGVSRDACNSLHDIRHETIVSHLNNQVRKAICKAEAKLDRNKEIRSSTEKVIPTALPVFVDDKATERALLSKQVKDITRALSAVSGGHRHKAGVHSLADCLGMVVKQITRRDKEWNSQGARDAVMHEVGKLVKAYVWDPQPLEKEETYAMHPDASYTRLFLILGLKNSESVDAKYKARVVVQGNWITDNLGDQVFFSDTTSAPTNMTCIRSVIAYGQLSKGGSSTADAEQAFIQPRMPDHEVVFVSIPDELKTDEMKLACQCMRNPVFRLRRPLYGWTRSGNIWEKHLETSLLGLPVIGNNSLSTRWQKVEGWPQTYYKIGTQGKPIVLTVYVDDLVMSGPGHEVEWEHIRNVVTTTEPTKVTRVLGVQFHEKKAENSEVVLSEIEMIDFLNQTLEAYHAVEASDVYRLREGVKHPWYEPSLKDIEELGNEKGLFASKAAHLLMKALYCGRMCRLDICYTINSLSRFVTKWSRLCDKQLCHLYSYLAYTRNTKLHATVDPSELDVVELHAYPDADLAGSYDTTKATSGGFLHLVGEVTNFPLEWYSKRQTATSHSSTEAETVSASKMCRESLAPLMDLWSILLQRPIRAVIHEDNQSTITVINAGYSQQLRHLQKHHRVSLGLVHEFCSLDDIDLRYIETSKQKGDMMTKGLDTNKHRSAMEMVGLYPVLVWSNQELRYLEVLDF